MEQNKRSNLDNARVGYQVAIDLAMSYASVTWSIFNAMVVANSIILAGITFVYTSSQSFILLKFLLPIMGLLLCVVWLLQTMRAISYVTYYTLSAREIEEKYLSSEVKTISRGGALADRRTVEIEIDGIQIKRRMKFLPRIVRGEWISYIIIIVVASVYIALLIQV